MIRPRLSLINSIRFLIENSKDLIIFQPSGFSSSFLVEGIIKGSISGVRMPWRFSVLSWASSVSPK